MESKYSYSLIAFFVSLLFLTLYNKFIVEAECPGKQPRSWMDHIVLSLPVTIVITSMVYYFTAYWSPMRQNNLGGNTSGNFRGNNMGRMNGNAYGRGGNYGNGAGGSVPIL